MEENVFKDKRFNHVISNPRFKSIPRNERKVKIDKRFQSMFTDKRFQVKYAVDERGRKINELLSENYKKYYDISDSSEESDSDNGSEIEENGEKEDKENKLISSQEEAVKESSSEDEVSSNSDEESSAKQKGKSESNLQSNEDNKQNLNESADNLDAESTTNKDKIKEKLKEVNKYIDEVHKTKLNEKVRERLTDITVDYARGIGTLLSGSESSSDEASSDESDAEPIEHPWGELDKDAEETEEVTRRLAVCNMDWDRVTAKDLMVLFHSFLPSDGIIESVTIYPSEFGLQRMAEEEITGPKELTETKEEHPVSSDEEIEEGSEYQREKLREYQLKRLKYYYAVIVCNSEETANTLYTECDGIEYESSAMKLDLRFIGDDITFDQKPHDVCTSVPDLKKYKPRLFINTALQQGTVNLTWDETDPNRIDFTRKVLAGEEVDEDEVQAYLASSSSEDEEAKEKPEVESDDDAKDDKERILKYRALMSSLQEESNRKRGDVEMEVTWGPDSTNKDHDIDEDDDNSANEDKSSQDSEMSSDDEIVNTKSAKKKKIKKKQNEKSNAEDENENAELELLLADDDPEETGRKHFSLKTIQKAEKEKSKKKWKKKLKKKTDYQEEDSFKIDATDSRFSALFTSHHFNIDPADPHFRKTKAMTELIAEKQKRRKLESS